MGTCRALVVVAGIVAAAAGSGSVAAELDAVFSDGFESGGVESWSSVATAAVPDPDVDGPFTSTSFQTTITVGSTGNTFGATVWVPTAGPLGPPYPLAVIAHGFQLPPGQYAGYAARLASFGYVAATPDYPTPLLAPDHRGNALDLVGVVDWAVSAPQLAGLVDVHWVAMLGHSLGGKAAVLAALLDDRVAVVVGLDPVDSSPAGCDPDDCPDVSALVGGLAIPSLLLGETLDAQACAPAADNYTTFYAATPSPSLEVTVVGASHMSFLDDVPSCGLPCLFCQTATIPDATVSALARAYAAAFLERWVRGRVAYDTYLTGAEAHSRYVVPGLATLRWREGEPRCWPSGSLCGSSTTVSSAGSHRDPRRHPTAIVGRVMSEAPARRSLHPSDPGPDPDEMTPRPRPCPMQRQARCRGQSQGQRRSAAAATSSPKATGAPDLPSPVFSASRG